VTIFFVLSGCCSVKSLPFDVLRYAAQHDSYPNESTADQFFGERQFEAYREAGYAACRDMLESNDRQHWIAIPDR
jgi:hypothetical protein